MTVNDKSRSHVGLGLGLVARYYRRQLERRLIAYVVTLWGVLSGPASS